LAFTDGSIDSEDWSRSIIGETPYGPENLRRCSKYLLKVLNKIDEHYLTQQIMVDVPDLPEDIQQKVIDAKAEIIKERKKMQQENARLQETYRWQARNELFNEKVFQAIEKLPPLVDKYSTKPMQDDKKAKVGNTGLIVVADLHAGSTFEIKDNNGKLVNAYNMDIMQDRLYQLLYMIEEDIDERTIDCDDIVVAIDGDLLENVLRMTSLMKLKDPVVDTVIQTSEILAHWITELYVTLHKYIKVVVVSGNHDSLALLGAKPRFDEENLGKLVVKFLELRLNGFPYITVQPYSEASVVNIQGVNVLFEHGVDNNLKDTLDYYANIFNIKIDEIIAGHLHHGESKSVGVADLGDRMIYRVGSIVGIDPYAKKIRAASKPSGYFALYEANIGHSWSKTYYLK